MFSSNFLSGGNPLSAVSSAVNKFSLFGEEGEPEQDKQKQQQQVQQQQLEAYTQHYSGTACSVGASELWAWQCEAWGDCQQ